MASDETSVRPQYRRHIARSTGQISPGQDVPKEIWADELKIRFQGPRDLSTVPGARR
jgi:hypothetical protein